MLSLCMPRSFWKEIWEFGQKGTAGVLWLIPKCAELGEEGWGADVLQHRQDDDCPPGNTYPFICISEQDSPPVQWDTGGDICIQLCCSEGQVQF